MQNSLPSAAASLPQAESEPLRARSPEDLVYQAMTVGAILLVLGSLWLF